VQRRELASLKDDVHGLHLITEDAYRSETYEEEIWNKLPDEATYGWASLPWTKKWVRWFATIKNERMMMYLVLFMILLVAAFSITNTLITVTVQKRREIGIINALGASVGQISALFLIQGFIVGLIGTSVGFALGWLVLHFRNTIKDWLAQAFGVELFPKEMYFLAEIPANLRSEDVTIICAGALIICMIAALPPAWMAARLDPAKALRSE
jgi:lipoprotein-releasing system permease protein